MRCRPPFFDWTTGCWENTECVVCDGLVDMDGRCPVCSPSDPDDRFMASVIVPPDPFGSAPPNLIGEPF